MRGRTWERSTPFSAIAWTATGLTSAAGSVPADSTSTRSPARCLRKPAAIWLRPALWTHTKRTAVRPTQALKGVYASLIRAVPQWDAGPGGRTIGGSWVDCEARVIHGGE